MSRGADVAPASSIGAAAAAAGPGARAAAGVAAAAVAGAGAGAGAGAAAGSAAAAAETATGAAAGAGGGGRFWVRRRLLTSAGLVQLIGSRASQHLSLPHQRRGAGDPSVRLSDSVDVIVAPRRGDVVRYCCRHVPAKW